MTEDATERFERIAALFQRDTGYMRPGKDVPAVLSYAGYEEERRAAWDKWRTEHPEHFTPEAR
jgi:hypothetical protein